MVTGRWRSNAVGIGFAAAWLAIVLAAAAITGVLGDLTGLGGIDAVAGAARDLQRTAGEWWQAIHAPVLVLVLVLAGVVASRVPNRQRRLARMRRFEIRLGREDVASPFKREKLFDAWHGQLSLRWWQRLAFGQPSMALELHHGRDGTQRLALVAPAGTERMLEGRLLETYPDVRLVAMPGAPAWTGRVLRLKKRRPFIERLQTLKDDEQSICESLITTMANVGAPATLQLVLTPAPAAVHRLSRWLLKRKERELTATERRARNDIGVDSVVEDKELKGALETQHRSLYFTELRIASNSGEAIRAIAGVFSEARAENRLVRRQMRLRRRLYATRLARTAPNPLPSWWRGVLSSSELGALWALPRQRAKGSQLVRSAVRRAPAPPEVCRENELAMMRDERGPVGLWPEDRKYGLALIGGQGTGKTAAMARTIAIDAQDSTAALIVLDPKHDLAEHALSLVPEGRTCWYMDLARPEVGLDPLGVDASPGVVADMLVAALREAHPDGSIMAASDRFLRHAAMAVCAVERRPTLWHMLELLSPRREEYRERVTLRLAGQPQHAALLRYWGRSFPELWEDATRGQLGMALDAPRNKLERLITTVEVDKALRHPFALDLRKVIQNREVLIVNGSLGDVGQDNAVTVMQLVLQLLHQALKQQQRLPSAGRPRVCLKVDEAHLVLTPSFAELLALHRAAGLEVVAAWQYNAQLRDPVVRSGLRSLLRSVSMFSMGEVRDARDQAEIAMEVYTDSIKSEREDIERLRVSPDDVVRLPVYTAVNSWVADGARRSAFIAGTFAMEERSDERRERHLDAQRAAGASWPSELPPPEEVAPSAQVSSAPTDDEEGTTDGNMADVPEPRPTASKQSARRATVSRRQQQAAGRPRRGAPRTHSGSRDAESPATYQAVHRDDIRGIAWDRQEPDPQLGRALEPTVRDLEILRALWRHRVLLTSQIAAEWWPDNDPSAAQRRLVKLTRAGWVRRFRPIMVEGTHEWIYQLGQLGHTLAQRREGPEGPYVPPDARFRDQQPTDFRLVAHDLQVNAWVMAYRRHARELISVWRGPEEGVLEVPQRRRGRRTERLTIDDVPLEGYVQVHGLQRRELARVSPDATLELELPAGRRVETLVELDRTRRATKNESKLLRYDALITAWWRSVERYRSLGEPPVVVFVCQSDHDLLELAGLAHRQVTGCLQNPGEPAERSRFPGRERMLFVSERDIHDGGARAQMLVPRPPEAGESSAVATREVRLPSR